MDGTSDSTNLDLARIKAVSRCESSNCRKDGAKKSTCRKGIIICLKCFNLKTVPLPKSATDDGYQPLVRCSKGYFNETEKKCIPILWNPAEGRTCPSFDGEDDSYKMKLPIGPRSKGHINLGDVLPPTLLAGIYKYLEGSIEVYLPARPNKKNAIRQKTILETYHQTKSIRKTAKLTGAHRSTVRNAIKLKFRAIKFDNIKINKNSEKQKNTTTT